MSGIRLRRYGEARDELLRSIVAKLQADERVIAAWLAGSLGRGEGDEWADLDLCLAIEDEALPAFLKERSQLYSSLGQVVLLQDQIPRSPPVADRFNLVNFASPYGPIEVDWSFQPFSEARKHLGHLVLFEKRPVPLMDAPRLSDEERRAHAQRWLTFFWAMAPIAVKYAGRGELKRAASQTDLLTRALIAMMRLLSSSEIPEPWTPDANNSLEDFIDARLPRFDRVITPRKALELILELCRTADEMSEELAALGAVVPEGIKSQTLILADVALAEIHASRFVAKRYR